MEASLQTSIYSYATAMNGLADQEDLRPEARGHGFGHIKRVAVDGRHGSP